MAEVAHQRAVRAVSPDLQRAGLVAAGSLALFAVVLYAQLPSILPGYPAVLIAFLVWAVAPGWLLQRALFGSRATGLVERLIVAFLMSMALAAAPGVLALQFHWSLQTFALLYAVIASAAGGLALLRRPSEDDALASEEPREEDRSVFAHAPLLLLVGVPLLAIATSPWWAGDRIARDADDWVYMAYVNEYVNADNLDATAPAAGGGAYQRMQANVWVVMQALVADASGVEPSDLLLSYLPAVLTLFAAVATYVLARGLFRSTTLALMAVVLQLGYAVLDLSPHEGFGRNFFLRIAEDKMVGSFILLPVGLLLAVRFLSKPSVRGFVAAQLVVLALFAVHPMALLFFGIAVVSFVGVRTAVERSIAPLGVGGVLLTPMVVVGVFSIIFLSQGATQLGGPFDLRLLFRRDFHIVAVTDDLSMGDYHLVLHPLMLAALALAPVIWWRSRREHGSQLLLATTLALLLLFFVPPFATALGKGVSWNAVWRLPWMIPVPVILARALYEVVRARPRVRLPALWPVRAAAALPRWSAPVVLIGVVLAAALLVQEQYVRADGGAFYNRTSSTELLPGTERSIVLGGLDRAFSGDWRMREPTEQLIAYLRAAVPPGSTVLAGRNVNVYLPGTLHGVHIVDALGNGTPQEKETVALLYSGSLRGPELAAELAARGVDYVVVERGSPPDNALRTIAVYDARALQARLGSPELAQRTGVAAAAFWAWSFSAQEQERVGGRRFTVPNDIDPEHLTLSFELMLAPSQPVLGDQTVRLVLSFFERGKTAAGDIVNAVADVQLADGTAAGEGILWRRSPRTPVKPGTTYGFAITRVPGAAEDTYPDDVWFIALRVKYQPAGLEEVEGTRYPIYHIAQ